MSDGDLHEISMAIGQMSSDIKTLFKALEAHRAETKADNADSKKERVAMNAKLDDLNKARWTARGGLLVLAAVSGLAGGKMPALLAKFMS